MIGTAAYFRVVIAKGSQLDFRASWRLSEDVYC